MNTNIDILLHGNFEEFLKQLELGVISQEKGMRAVINSEIPRYIYEFAKKYTDAEVLELGKVIIESKDPEEQMF